MTDFDVTPTSTESSADRTKLQWTVSSKFGTNKTQLVTVILNNAPENSFYFKHVEARGESPRDVYLLRNRAVQESPAPRDPYRLNRARLVYDAITLSKQEIKRASINTVIRLRRIDHDAMIFHFAQALFNKKQADNIITKDEEFEVEVVFPAAHCVITLPNDPLDSGGARPDLRGKPVICRSMCVCARFEGGDDSGRMAFEVLHCCGPGSI